MTNTPNGGTTMTIETTDQTTEISVSQPRDTAVMPGFNSQSSWELAQRIGKAFAASELVPAAYRNNLANCIVALEMANRMGASPLMVMQNLYMVHGNPGWSSKFLIASFNQCGRFSALRYEWNKDRTACRAWAVEKATGERIDGPQVTMQMAKDEGWATKSGSKWKTMPELMLMYRAAAFLIRTYAPEISMGLRTDDEIMDTVEEVRGGSIDAVRSALQRAPSPMLPVTPPPDQPPSTGRKTLADFVADIDGATSKETAALVLDEAAQALSPDDMAKLNEAFDMAWQG